MTQDVGADWSRLYFDLCELLVSILIVAYFFTWLTLAKTDTTPD